ncbi:MAG: class I SAM-dependent methyltransferase [Anaerolineaceae bacterium]
MSQDTVVNINSDIYYRGQYWNDFPPVLEYMSENFTGDKNKWWVQDFLERFCKTSFEHGLVLNCGNGWVERELIDKGAVSKVTAFDYSMDLLKKAHSERGNRSIFYFQADVNRVDFKENQFDLIINVASLHHVQYINRICRILCKSLQKDGLFVNYDYIGPHRNQYPIKQWRHIKRVNHSLPDSIKKNPLKKPHLPTMLISDPSEAIHSELIIETVSKYFDLLERHDTGGGIAYELLTHNEKLQHLPKNELNIQILKILKIDKELTIQGKVPSLFSYFLAKPNKNLLDDKSLLAKLQSIENAREQKSRTKKGVYSFGQYLNLQLHQLSTKLKIRA